LDIKEAIIGLGFLVSGFWLANGWLRCNRRRGDRLVEVFGEAPNTAREGARSPEL
jgi:hypothetical protein